MLTFKNAQAVSGIYFTQTSCCVIGKNLCKCPVLSASEVCCFSVSFPSWTHWRLAKLASVLMQEPRTLVETFRQERAPKWTKKQLLWELIVWCTRPPTPFPRRVIKKMQLICFTVPLRRYFTPLPGFHLQQPRLKMLTVLLLSRVPVLFAGGRNSTQQNSSKLIRSLDECLGPC